MANIPAVIACTDEMTGKHPELTLTFIKGMIKVGRRTNEHGHAAAARQDREPASGDPARSCGCEFTIISDTIAPIFLCPDLPVSEDRNQNSYNERATRMTVNFVWTKVAVHAS